jgi:hypothetical protein
MRGEVEQWKEEFIRQLDQFRCEYNTQSYDKFIAVGKCQANIRASMTFRSRFIDMAVPFMDTELVREAMRMRSWSRFMDAVYRRDITAVNPAAAKVRTTHGLTASSRKSDVTLDSCRAVRFYGERFLKAAGRKFFGKSLFLRWADVPQLRQDVVRTRLYHDSLSRLKQMRIIAENAEPVQLAPQSGRVICLAVVLDSLVDRPLHVG